MAKRGADDVKLALVVGAGLLTAIAAIESRRGRTSAPVVTKGGSGRWSSGAASPYVRLDPRDLAAIVDIVRATLSQAEAIALAQRVGRPSV